MEKYEQEKRGEVEVLGGGIKKASRRSSEEEED
jgi:hypothetical protein